MDCAELFTKVPTDQGICCAFNTENAVKPSLYSTLVNEMQNSIRYKNETKEKRKKIAATYGKENGLRITLDRHSNFEAIGSVYEEKCSRNGISNAGTKVVVIVTMLGILLVIINIYQLQKL